MKYLILLLTLFSFNALADEPITLSFDKVTEFTDGTLIPEEDHKGYKVFVNGEFLLDLGPDELTFTQSFPDGTYIFTLFAVAWFEGQNLYSESSDPDTKTLPTKRPKKPEVTVTVTVTTTVTVN